MKYKVVTIDGDGIVENYKRRAYIITKNEKEDMPDHFVTRETIDKQRIFRSCETGRCYIIKQK